MTQQKRRQYGTGSVYRRAADGKWLGVVDAGYTKASKRRRVTVVAATEAEAKRKLRDKVRAIEAGAQASTRMTVKAWSDTWLELIVKKRRPNSYAADRAAVRNWIVPTIGHKQLSDLTPANVRAVSAAAVAPGNSTSTARRYHATLMTMLKAALREGHAVPERLLLVEPPAIALNDRQAFPVEDALKMLAVATTLPHGSRWAVAFLQGLRPGECRGMTDDALDFSGELGQFGVSWQLQALPYNVPRDRTSGFRVPDAYEVRQVAGALHLVRPKTKASRRAYPMVPWVRQALAHWLEIAPETLGGPRPAGLLWPMAADDKADKAEWRWLQDQAQVRHPSGRYYHRHEARHTTATLLLALKAPERVRVAIMGHSSVTSTETYEHVDDPQLLAALLSVAARLELT